MKKSRELNIPGLFYLVSAEKIKSHSFDKGFWSKGNLATLQGAYIEQVVPPNLFWYV